MTSEKAEVYPRRPASSLGLGDVLVEDCNVEGHTDCEGVHERIVREVAKDSRLVLIVTQNDAGIFSAEVMRCATQLRVLRSRLGKKRMLPLSEEFERTRMAGSQA